MTRKEFFDACAQVDLNDEAKMFELEKQSRTSVELKVIFYQWSQHWFYGGQKPESPTT